MGTEKSFVPKAVYDAIRSLPFGMNSGVDQQNVPRGQAAFIRNGTVRGQFVTHRPAYNKITLSSTDVSMVPASGIAALGGAQAFQGAAYHSAKDGTQSLMAAVAGRLFRFAISGTGAAVSELTTPSLQQSGIATQAWLWQAERFLVFQDGLSLPLFWDGATLRRSRGVQTLTVGTTNLNFTTPSPGNAVTIQLGGPYTGPYDSPISIGNYTYLIHDATAGAGTSAYKLTLQNLYGGANDSVASGTALTKATAFFSFINSPPPVPPAGGDFTFTTVISPPYFSFNLPVATKILMVGGSIVNGTITGMSGVGNMTISVHIPTFGGGGGFFTPLAIYDPNNGYQTIASTVAAFTDPTPGNSVSNVTIDQDTHTTPPFSVYNTTLKKQWMVTAQTIDTSVNYTLTGTNVDQPQNQPVNQPANLVWETAELPAGRMGAYGRGRNWLSLTDGLQYIGGDIVDGESGTVPYDGEDAVLSITENLFLSGGGTFRVPASSGGQIQAMIFAAQPDTSLGQGPLLVFTPDRGFSCDAPVDRTTWQNLTNPIQTESIIANGAVSHYGTVNCNTDTIFRAPDGIRSRILGRRQYDKWGDTPMSREVDFVNADDRQLLQFCSAIEFDNRVLMTTGPVQSSLGVYHTGIVALNNDGVSSLQGKSPSCYDGIWDAPAGGVLQLVKGEFAGQTRAFAFCLSTDRTAIELWEIKRTDDPYYKDSSGPIVWRMESGALDFGESDPRKRDYITLTDGELRVDLMGKTYGRNGAAITTPHQILFETFYRGDQDPNWIPWYSFTQTFDPNANDPGYRPALGLGTPDPSAVDTVNDIPQRTSTTFQVALQVTGHCRLLNWRMKGTAQPIVDLVGPAQST